MMTRDDLRKAGAAIREKLGFPANRPETELARSRSDFEASATAGGSTENAGRCSCPAGLSSGPIRVGPSAGRRRRHLPPNGRVVDRRGRRSTASLGMTASMSLKQNNLDLLRFRRHVISSASKVALC